MKLAPGHWYHARLVVWDTQSPNQEKLRWGLPDFAARGSEHWKIHKNYHGPDFVHQIFSITIDSRKCFKKETLSQFTFQQDFPIFRPPSGKTRGGPP